MYIFRLILVCIPLFGAVAATAEAQRMDRELQSMATAGFSEAEPEIVLALNTLLPVLVATDAIADVELQVSPVEMASASSGLPVCLALVLLVALVRRRGSV